MNQRCSQDRTNQNKALIMTRNMETFAGLNQVEQDKQLFFFKAKNQISQTQTVVAESLDQTYCLHPV